MRPLGSLHVHHRQQQARWIGGVVVDRVGADLRRVVGMREHAIGRRRIAVGELKPDAMAFLEHVGDRQHLDVELVDLAGRAKNASRALSFFLFARLFTFPSLCFATCISTFLKALRTEIQLLDL
jgi:hypothetical protein